MTPCGSRETHAFDPLIISVTGFAGGGAYNVIADRATLRGTIRSGKPETRRHAHLRLEAVAAGLASSHSATAATTIVTGEPPVQNDAGMVQLIRSVAPGAFLPLSGWTAADDFGFYSRAKPAIYFRLGIRDEAMGSVHPLHHPEFRVGEDAMSLGAATLAAAAMRFLERG